jgi:alcohol dehydrogenase
MYAHCEDGGWIGHLINGTQAEYVRIMHADNSLYLIPDGADGSHATPIFPTGHEIGVINGGVKPGNSAIVELDLHRECPLCWPVLFSFKNLLIDMKIV